MDSFAARHHPALRAQGTMTPAFLSVVALALLPAVGNVIGTAIAELSRLPRWVIGAALHAAAGIAVALVSVDLIPRILDTSPTWILLSLFSIGAAISFGLAKGVQWFCRLIGGGATGAWMVYMATAADLLSDGLITGATSAVSAQLGLLLALSQVIGNIPGGFAAIGNFRSQGVGRRTRLLAAGSLVLPVLVGASIGFWALGGAGAAVQNGALALIVGTLLVTTIEDLVPEADKPGAPRSVSTASFVVGFGFFAILASYLQ